jgi:hypothetical protein
VSKHDAYLTCDICGKVVATIKGRLFPRKKAVCGFYNIPRYYSMQVLERFCHTYEKTVKEDWGICDGCLVKIVGEIESNEVDK